MSFFGEQYPLYYPQYISGYEKVKMNTTTQKTTMEMEQRIRMRYAFAMSSFGRMFRPEGIVLEMRILCDKWSKNTEDLPPGMDLYQVDRYFLELWKKRNEPQEGN
jgi:hypothetical protein